MPIASGVDWIAKFPTRADTAACVSPFRERLEAFLAALKASGATVQINATLRPPERAYLMHTCWEIAQGNIEPNGREPRAGVDIDWIARDASGNPDLNKSRAIAQQMVKAYQIAFEPSLTSLHITGRPSTWTSRGRASLQIADKSGPRARSQPAAGRHQHRPGQGGRDLGVFKLVSDPPHWSINGH